MTRRAGLIDSPSGAVKAPNLGGGAHPAAAQAYDDLAKAAQSLSDTFIQPQVDKATEKRASDAVMAGEFGRSAGVTRQDQIYDKIVDAGFMAQSSTDIEKTIGELENKHLGDLDMDAFTTELTAARDAHLEGIDSRYAVQLRQTWDQRGLSATQRLSGIAVQKGIKRADEALTARADLKLNEISGASDLESPDVAMALDEVERIHRARIAKGDMTQEESDAILSNAISKVQANRIGGEAMVLFEAGGKSDAAYAEAAKMLDDAIASPDLNLSRTERAAYLGAARQSLNAARSEARRAERELATEIKTAEREAAGELRLDLADAALRAGEGFAPTPQEIGELTKRALSTGAAAPALLARIQRLAVTGQVQQEMRGYSIPQQEEFVGSLELSAANGNADAAVMLDSARKVAANARRAAEADPATYAAVTEKRDIPTIDWADPAATLESMSDRFRQAVVAADQLGVGVKYFSPADRTQLKAIADKGGAEALSLATSLVRAADAADVEPLEVLAEVGGSGAPLLATAGALMAQGVPPDAAMKILAGKAAMGSELVKDKMPKQATQASAQRKVLGDKLGKMPASALDALTRSADAHYATTLLENEGEAPGGEREAYEASMRAVLGEWKDESGRAWGGQADMGNGRKTTAPPWIVQKDFPTVVKTMTPEELASAAGMGGPLGVIGTRDATPADYRGAALIDAGGGMYYIAPDPNRPDRLISQFRTYPMPVIFNLNRVRETLKVRVPDAVR